MTVGNKKYKVEDKELLVGVYNKLLWRHLVPRIPRSITPNAITIFGQFAALAGLITAFLATQGMPFLYVVSGLMWFTYLTADNLDGQHARATGQTSVLGEFLDHGLDGFASGCLLLTCSIILGMDGIWMAMFLALGALGFIVTFWEQYRTGRLILPEISAAEGVTLVIVLNFILAFGGEPPWMQFSIEHMTAATWVMLVVLLGYASATFAPTFRIFKHTGGRIGEILPVLAIGAASCVYVALGSVAPMPAIMVSMFGGDVVCRMIRLRHQGEDAPIVATYHWLLVLPLIPAAAGAWTASGWAVVAMGMSVVMYGVTLFRSGSAILSSHDRPSGGEASAS